MTLILKRPTGTGLILKRPVGAGLKLANLTAPYLIGGTPALDFRFAVNKSLVDHVSGSSARVSFARNSIGSYNDAAGNIQIASANQARFTHDDNQISKGLMIEAARTNIVRNSFNAVNCFTGGDATLTEVVNSTQPDGSIGNVLRVRTEPGVSIRYHLTLTAQSGNPLVGISAFLRIVSGTNFLISAQSSTSGPPTAWAIGTRVTPVAAWRRYAFAGSPSSGSPAGNWAFVIGNDTRIPVIGSGGSATIDIWGPQLELGSTVTSYIPTESSQVTRQPDICTIDLTGISATRTMVEKPEGCAVMAGNTITLQGGYTAERVIVFPAALSSNQIAGIREVM